MVQWWSPEALQKFMDGANCFVNQYLNITDPVTNLKLNGRFTNEENIADNGGLKLAYKVRKCFIKNM